MSSVESKIVTMKFDNAQFQQGAQQSMSIMEKLKSSMNFSGAGAAASKGLGGIASIFSRLTGKNPFASTTAGLSEMNRSANGVAGGGFQQIQGGITGISAKFAAMAIVATTALSNIVTRATDAGLSLVKAFTIEPVSTGFSEYETNLKSVQTILANTQVAGTNISDVNRTLDELNRYADKTIYNFGEMTKNIGTFTAAGVDLETATASIKGIANLAALSGSNSQQASTAMYQLSQEIAAGRVSLMGWNSVVNAGMGGATFQRALVRTAENMGELEGKTVKFTGKMKNATIDGKSFRDSIMAKPGEQSWLTSKVLTETLSQMTGDLTDAELAAKGYSKAQIKAIQTQAKTAQSAAQDVKTLGGVLEVAKESAGSGWATTWRLIFGDFKEAKTLFTGMSNAVQGVIDHFSSGRNEMLAGWKLAGGRSQAIVAFKDVFASLGAIFKSVGSAWRSVFPKTTANDLLSMTNSFRKFAAAMKPSEDTLNKMKRTFAGFFAILHIGWSIIKGVATVIADLIGVAATGAGGFLSITASIGDFLVWLDKAITSGEGFKKVFRVIGQVLSAPIVALQTVGRLIGALFEGFSSGAGNRAAGSMERMSDAMSPLKELGSGIIKMFGKLGEVLGKIGSAFADIADGLVQGLAEGFASGDYSPIFDALNTGLLAGIALMIKKFFSDGFSVNVLGGGGAFDSIKDMFDGLTGTLEAMQTRVKAEALLKIAAAVGILTLSLVALSIIDSAALTKSLTAMGVAFTMLMVAMTVLDSIGGKFAGLKFTMMAIGMIALATAIGILTTSIMALSLISWPGLIKGLSGLAGILVILSASSSVLSKNSKGMLAAGAGITAMSVGIAILAGAITIMSKLSMSEMTKGLVTLAVGLTAVAFAAGAIPKSILATGPGLVAFAAGLVILSSAVAMLGKLSWDEIGRGLTVLASSLTIIGIASALIPASILAVGPGLIAVGIALVIITKALEAMAKMSWDEFGKSMAVLAGALTILAIGLSAMIVALPGAIALTVATAALMLFIPVLLALGSMSWSTIATGLTTIALTLGILGVAGLALAPVSPIILILAAAILLLGAGVALAGAGILALATGLTMLVTAFSAGSVVIVTAIQSLLQQLPRVGTSLAQMMVRFAVAIGQNAPKFAQAFTAVMTSMLNSVIKIAPKLSRALTAMINAGLNVVIRTAPRFAQAAVRLINAFLTAVSNNMGKFTDKGATLAIRFMQGISRNADRVADAAVKMITNVIRATAGAISRNQDEIREAGKAVGRALVDGMIAGVEGMASGLAERAASAARGASRKAKDVLGIGGPSRVFCEYGKNMVQGWVGGISSEEGSLIDTVESSANKTIDALRYAMGEGMMSIADTIDPTITPVLDLTQLTQDAAAMNSIFGAKPLSTSVSYGQAADISADTQLAAEQAALRTSEPKAVEITQINQSPKALDTVAVYRQTKSLVALSKEALDL